jgi:hypothetical protein
LSALPALPALPSASSASASKKRHVTFDEQRSKIPKTEALEEAQDPQEAQDLLEEALGVQEADDIDIFGMEATGAEALQMAIAKMTAPEKRVWLKSIMDALEKDGLLKGGKCLADITRAYEMAQKSTGYNDGAFAALQVMWAGLEPITSRETPSIPGLWKDMVKSLLPCVHPYTKIIEMLSSVLTTYHVESLKHIQSPYGVLPPLLKANATKILVATIYMIAFTFQKALGV